MLDLAPYQDALDAFARRWQVKELALFGSALREDFGPESDVDVLVSFDPEARWSLLDVVDMRAELLEVFGRPVDLVTKAAVTTSPNWIRRQAILESARVIYAG